ncbi:hypothetical protein A4R26_08360 [Niastella populi]|uniref:Uncharacterized protein n=1 Tax=Niastella populi TaxID=550983 RepID=A0A1V9EKQ2_9BACT|nr:hypothetical protein A4R26_08360 [Niastella populi]
MPGVPHFVCFAGVCVAHPDSPAEGETKINVAYRKTKTVWSKDQTATSNRIVNYAIKKIKR